MSDAATPTPSEARPFLGAWINRNSGDDWRDLTFLDDARFERHFGPYLDEGHYTVDAKAPRFTLVVRGAEANAETYEFRVEGDELHLRTVGYRPVFRRA